MEHEKKKVKKRMKKFELFMGHLGNDITICNDIVNIGLHFFLKNVRPYAASCSEA